MNLARLLPSCVLLGWIGFHAPAHAQQRPYIGFIYPAGGQTNSTFRVHVGGQRLDKLAGAQITGKGVTAKIIEYRRLLGAQDMRILREQTTELRKITKKPRKGTKGPSPAAVKTANAQLKKIQVRLEATVRQPACASIANVAIVEVKIDRRAKLGERELRLVTQSGTSNPMPFHVGGQPEVSRKPLGTCEIQVLGKEENALRRRPPEEAETRIHLPCTVNGQISPGEVDRYRFTAKKGQHLVFTTLARQLVPYIADAVPGWFQPILTILDDRGHEVAYEDDFRFKPDPVILFKVPKDGEYVFSIRDSIYRGREDFVYRITAGQLPFVTSISPRGWQWNREVPLKVEGVNLGNMKLKPPSISLRTGVHMITRTVEGPPINPIPFAVDKLPDLSSKEPNDSLESAQAVNVPVIVNGSIQKPGDSDWYSFTGRAAQYVVFEVMARRLDSPLDSMMRIFDASGSVLASNDDHAEPGNGGLNTHHADSYVRLQIPRDGTYYVQLSDTTQAGGEGYGYRLRISPPQPDFDLRVVPSSISLRNRGSGQIQVHAFRHDGFANPITLSIPRLPRGLSATPVVFVGTQQVAKVTIKSDWRKLSRSFSVIPTVMGSAFISGRTPTHKPAIPTEDRMQAFLWRHLVPAADFRVHVYNPSYKPPRPRVASISPAVAAMIVAKVRSARKDKEPTLTKGQAMNLLRQLQRLFESGLLTDEFYFRKVAETRADEAS
jgi:hypothetical protein